MTNKLFLSPSLDTALNHLAQALEASRQAHPFAPVTLLLPDSAAVQAVRKRLGTTMAVRLYQFYGLGQMILDAASLNVYRLNEITIRRLVKQILAQMAAESCLTSFTPVWETPGFQQVLIEWLREMKNQGIAPEAVAANAVESGQERDRQLAEFYGRYQSFMHQQACSDADGLLWLAAEALENTSTLPLQQQLFAALGFDQFNPLQVRILRAFAGHCADFRIYLPWDAARPAGSLALTRLTLTRQRLEEAICWEAQTLSGTQSSDPLIDLLQRRVFEPPASDPADAPFNPLAMQLVAAPSREAEVRWALKSIKRLLLDGVTPDQIALLAPSPGAYQRLVEVIAAEYGVPVQVEHRLGDNPAAATLLSLLTLAPEFSWRQTMDALRSPYLRLTGLSSEQVDQIDRLSRERPVLSGRDQWRFALSPIDQVGEAQVEDEDLGPPRLASRLAPETLAALENGLMAFFDLLTPPASASYRGYTRWLQHTILGLFPEQAEAEAPTQTAPASLWLAACSAAGRYARRDSQALSLVMRTLRALVDAAERVAPDGPASQQSTLDAEQAAVAWADYRADLLRLLPGQALPADPLQTGVRFASLETGRSQVVDHLLVLGLAEGEFPRLPAPDVLYAPVERETHPLPLIRARSGEQASLWWQVLSNVRCSLVLLRPRLDEKGAPWLPSSYWEAAVLAVQGALPQLQELVLPIVDQPTLDQAASPAELLIALAQGSALRVPGAILAPWQASQAAASLLRRRQSWQPVAGFEGVLSDSEVDFELAQRYGPGHNWSASRLNRYGRCPYSFFATYILDLEERADPSEGFDALQRGTLLHAILEKLYSRLTRDGIALTSTNQPAVERLLEDCCARAFERAPERYGFQPGPLWAYEQAELRRMLLIFMRWECEQNGDAPRSQPYRQELRFGIHGSPLPNLTVESAEGFSFAFHGVIDRLDRDVEGRLRLVDYKSGSTKYSKQDIVRGLAFQSPLYALAAERLIPDAAVAESAYLHLPIREKSGKLEFGSTRVADHDVVREAIERAALFVQNIRQGAFPTLPARTAFGQNGCAGVCEFSSLCRADRHAVAKARQGGWL